MGAYSYRALDAGGRMVKGVLEGDSQRQIRQQLRQRALTPVEVEAVAGGVERTPLRPLLRARLSGRDVALLTRQLATLVESGMPLADALQAAAQQNRKARAKSVLLAVRSRVVEGYPLAYGLGEFPAVFDSMYRAMVLAGENAGYLGPVLTRLADHAENRQFTQQKLRMAMIYPLILVGVAAAVIAALMRFVVPELVRIFQTSNADLPLLTRILIATSNFLGDFGLALLLGVVLGLVALGRLFRNEAARLRRDQFLLRVPIIGELLRGLESARYASTLSILIGSGVPMLQALGIAGEVLGNRVLRQAAEGVRMRVEQGTSLHRALEDSAQFPPMLVHLIASGEASGELENMLSRAATTQERDTEMALGAMMSLFEPLLVVFMGGFVLLVVLAVLMPIFDLNTLVK